MISTMKLRNSNTMEAVDTSPSGDFFHCLAAIGARLKSAPRTFVLVSFDGVLTAGSAEPDAVTVAASVRRSLQRLCDNARFCVGVIGSRRVSELALRVGVSCLLYAGNGGLAITAPGVDFVEPEASRRSGELLRLTTRLEEALQSVPGTLVRNHGITATVHFGRVDQGHVSAVHQLTNELVKSAPGGLFEIGQGLDFMEVRPHVAWTKGLASQWMIAASGVPESLPIYLSNDSPEEDAFKTLQSGITIKVGKSANPDAHYHLRNQEDVAPFLDWLSGHC